MDSILISVIIPVYKVEKYLDKCVESIINQSEKNFEIILVDDCSPDKSGELCDAWALRDSRVRVIHHEQNQGVSAARNSAIAVSRGQWIMMVDSDDWIEADAFEKIIPHLSDEIDILAMGIIKQKEKSGTYKSEIILPSSDKAKGSLQIAEALIKLDKQRCFPYIWNKVYKSDFIKNNKFRFENTDISEDFFFNFKLFSAAAQIVTVPVAYYNYRNIAGESLTQKYHADYYDICKRRYNCELGMIEQHGILHENIYDVSLIHIKHLISTLLMLCAPYSPLDKKERKSRSMAVIQDSHTAASLYLFQPKGVRDSILKFMLTQHSYFVLRMFLVAFRIILK